MGSFWANLGAAGQSSLLSDVLVGKGGGSVQGAQSVQPYMGKDLIQPKEQQYTGNSPATNNQVVNNQVTYQPTNDNVARQEPDYWELRNIFEQNRPPKRPGGSLW